MSHNWTAGCVLPPASPAHQITLTLLCRIRKNGNGENLSPLRRRRDRRPCDHHHPHAPISQKKKQCSRRRPAVGDQCGIPVGFVGFRRRTLSAPYSIQSDSVRSCSVQCNSIWCNSIRFDTVRSNAVQFGPIRFDTSQFGNFN